MCCHFFVVHGVPEEEKRPHGVPVTIQLAPESEEEKIFPAILSVPTTAKSLMPSLDEVMPFQYWNWEPWVQVTPELGEVQMCPAFSTAASLVPSLEEAIFRQFFPVGAPDGAQSIPELVDR